MSEVAAPLAPAAAAEGTADAYVPAEGGMIKYNLYYTFSRTNATLHVGTKKTKAHYYCETDTVARKPRIFLREGDSKTSPMLAFVQGAFTSRHMLVAKGDYKHQPAENIQWDDLTREKNTLRCSDYHFSTAEGSPTGALRLYDWNKNMNKPGRTIYHCLDEDGTVVANLFSGGGLNLNKGGEIDVLETLDPSLRVMLITSALGIWGMEALNYQSLLRGYDKEDKNGHEKKA